MSRILIAWELGLNSGHLIRLLPVCSSLKARGHSVLAAVRDLATAAKVLGPAGITLVQAPVLIQGRPLAHRPTGYADILLSQGWSDYDALWGLLEGWNSLLRMFRPDVIVADFSPTACLAARASSIPFVCMGNGFEIPPPTNPLPPFPGFSWAKQEVAKKSEDLALKTVAKVLARTKIEPLEGLRDLFPEGRRLFATFPEMDHYGKRIGERYIGHFRGNPVAGSGAWQTGSSTKKIFAYLRRDTPGLPSIIGALHEIDAEVICVAPDVEPEMFAACKRVGFAWASNHLNVDRLLADTDLCVSYGAEGTVITFLLAGCPQITSPLLVESFLTARRVTELGAGTQLSNRCSTESVLEIDANNV